MAIVKANIIAEANQRAGRSFTEAQYDIAFKSLLHEMARENLLRSSTSLTLTAGVANYAITNAKKLILAQYYDVADDQYSVPMDMISWSEYRVELGRNLANSTPVKIAFYEGSIYLSAPPDTTNDLLYYTVLLKHTDSIDSISFEDDAREALVEGLCYKAYELIGLQNTEKALTHKNLYDLEKDALSSDKGIESSGSSVKYSDI